jgi:hypothetical protein
MGSGGEAHRLRPRKMELGTAERRGFVEAEQCRAARGRRCRRSGCWLGEDAPRVAVTSLSTCSPSPPFSLLPSSPSPLRGRWERKTPRRLGFLAAVLGVLKRAVLGFAARARTSRAALGRPRRKDAWRHHTAWRGLGFVGRARWPTRRRGGFAPVSRSEDKRGVGAR